MFLVFSRNEDDLSDMVTEQKFCESCPEVPQTFEKLLKQVLDVYLLCMIAEMPFNHIKRLNTKTFML